MSAYQLPGRRLPLLLAAVLVVLGLSAAPALAGQANGQINSFSFQPTATKAGGSADLNVNVGFSQTPTSMQLNFAPGLWASLAAAPSGTQVGTGSVNLTAAGLLPQTASATIKTETPQIPAGQPPLCGAGGGTNTPFAKQQPCVLTGFDLNADDKTFGLQTDAHGLAVVNPSTASLQMVFPSIPTSVDGIPIAITNLSLKLPGSTSHGQFIRLPSYDSPATSTATMKSQQGSTGSGQDTFTPTGTPAYSPSVASANVTAAAPGADGQRRAQTVIDIQQPDHQAGDYGDSLVVPGNVLSVSGGAIHDLCGPPNPSTNCQNGSVPITNPVQVGSATLQTPLLPSTVTGGTFALYGSPNDPHAVVQFPSLGGLGFNGSIDPTSIGTNPTMKFQNIPDVPFTDLKVTLDANPQYPGTPSDGGLLNATCNGSSGSLQSVFTPWWGPLPPVSSSAQVNVNGCPPPGAPAPTPPTPTTPGVPPPDVGPSVNLPAPVPVPAPKPKRVPVMPTNPTASAIRFTGIAKGQPKLTFTVNRGKLKPKFSSFIFEPPGAFKFTHNALRHLHLSGAKLKHWKLVGRKLEVTLKAPVTHARLTINPGAMSEGRMVKLAVREQIATSLSMNIWAKPNKPYARVPVKIKHFS